MKCDKCGREATCHISINNNGNYSEQYLCSECAKASGQDYEPFQMFNIGEFFGFPAPVSKKKMYREVTCPHCGYTASKFLNTGYLGCSECYDALSESVDPVINRLYGNTMHAGKIPLKKTEIKKSEAEELQEKLQVAVKEERYEDAAVLKSQIDKLKEGK